MQTTFVPNQTSSPVSAERAADWKPSDVESDLEKGQPYGKTYTKNMWYYALPSDNSRRVKSKAK